MTIDEFTATLSQEKPPAGISPEIAVLWLDANEKWEEAHNICQSHEGTKAFDQLHAYLHRKEGDESNARYWYRRAGIQPFSGSLDQEWNALATQFLRA